MKKRTISLLLCLTLCLTLLPAAALAVGPSLSDGSTATISSSAVTYVSPTAGTVVYTPATATDCARLELTNAQIDGGSAAAISSNVDLCIVLHGNSTIIGSVGIRCTTGKKLTITTTSGGTLRITASSGAAISCGSLEVNAAVDCTGLDGTSSSTPALNVSGAVTLASNAALTVASQHPIVLSDTLTIVSGAVLTLPYGTTMQIANDGSTTSGLVQNSGTFYNQGVLKFTGTGVSTSQLAAMSLLGDGIVQLGSSYYKNDATPLQYKSALDLSSLPTEGTLDTDGYHWDASTNSLTLKNIVIDTITRPGTLETPLTITISSGAYAYVHLIDYDASSAQNGPKSTVIQGGTLYANHIEVGNYDCTLTDIRGAIDGIMNHAGNGDLRIQNATLTFGHAATTGNPIYLYYNASDTHGVFVENSTLNITGNTDCRIWVGRLSMDQTSTITFQNVGIGNYCATDEGLQNLRAYLPAAHTIGRIPSSSIGYTVLYDGAVATNFTLTYHGSDDGTELIPGDGNGSGRTDAHRIIILDSEHGTTHPSASVALRGATVILRTDPDAGYTLRTLSAADHDDEPLELTDLGLGRYAFRMPDSTVTVATTFRTTNALNDVPADSYYRQPVLWALGCGLADGIGDGCFAPDAACSRAHLVTFLWRAVGCPVASFPLELTDVAESDYYAEAVRWALSCGIVTGYPDGTFRPDEAVTRQQCVTMLYRFARAAEMPIAQLDADIDHFRDASTVSNYALPAVRWAVGAQILRGASGALCPHDTCTRAQIITMLYRLLHE